MQAEMVIDTAEFLAVLKRLKPKKISKASLREELYIALFNGEAIFCMRGIQTRCVVEKANWQGYIAVNSGVVLSFLAGKPAHDTVKLSVGGQVLQIEGLKTPCKIMQSPEWITAMSFEAHLNDDPKQSPQSIDLYCPKCGKKRGEYFKQKIIRQPQLGDPPPPRYPSTRRCHACQHQWLEFADLS
jgi:DNA-directed RNA polymerase subunit M/transcription elongation factor TFIIS